MRRERRLTELKCTNCGHKFVERVPQIAHGVAKSSELTPWIVDRIDVRCPRCGPWLVGERNA